MNDIQYILDKAIKAGVCADSIPALTNARTIPDLLTLLVSPQGVEFLMEHDFPSTTDLTQLASTQLEQYGIYVDANYTPGSALTILLGSSTANIQATECQVKHVCVKHQSQARVSANNHSFVVVDVYDDANVHVFAKDQAKVLVNVYGNANVRVEKQGAGMVKVVNKVKSK